MTVTAKKVAEGDEIKATDHNSLVDDVQALDAKKTAYNDLTGKPSTFPPTVGTTATTAKAGNYVPTYAEVKDKPTTFAPAAHTHKIADITGLEDRLKAVEDKVNTPEG